LKSIGFHEESLVLACDDVINNASKHYHSGMVLTALDEAYPSRWIERLKEFAPPALWLSGNLSATRYIGIVGTRDITPEAREFTIEVGRETVKLGYGVVSGGAVGADLAGVRGALLEQGQVLELLPYGIDRFAPIEKAGLSVCPPSDEFTISQAMERNTLIYAASEATVVIDPRFKEGGTWHGAVEANRRKLCPLIIRATDTPSCRALVALGAQPMSDPSELASILQRVPLQRGLFSMG